MKGLKGGEMHGIGSGKQVIDIIPDDGAVIALDLLVQAEIGLAARVTNSTQVRVEHVVSKSTGLLQAVELALHVIAWGCCIYLARYCRNAFWNWPRFSHVWLDVPTLFWFRTILATSEMILSVCLSSNYVRYVIFLS